LPVGSVDIYAFGRKAAEYFTRRGYTLAAKFENVSDDVPLAELEAIAPQITAAYENKSVDRVLVVYTNFKSTFEQEAVAHTLLPLSVPEFAQIVAGIVPTKGALAVPKVEGPAPTFYTVEPAPEEVLAALVPRLASVYLYHMLLESKASEHSARMIAMKNASDKSRDLSKELTRIFNKTRQAVITREVSEIVGGIEAMAVN
jgi:F-type H+-transporting ATPase subunit gamma